MSLSPATDGRLPVAKTYKLYVGGAFPRSESGRSYPVTDSRGRLLAHAALASRKDVRDAVTAARGALAGWSGATAYNRGQVLYRAAEMMQARRGQFVDDVVAAEGVQRRRASTLVDAAIDRWVWYAGWTDKIATVLGSVNPVAGPFVNWSAPEPTGVIAVLAPQASSLLGLVDVLAPVLATGCTAVVVTSEARPLPAVGLGEVLATSDAPGRGGQPAHRPHRRAGTVARRTRRGARDRSHGRARRARGRAGTQRGRHRQARAAPPGHRAGPHPAARNGADPRLVGDQDDLAPGRALNRTSRAPY